MSFILDAIAKSEQERQQQEVPGARTLALPATGIRQPRRVLPYFVGGALLLNAVVLVIWMQAGQTLLNWSSPTVTKDIDQATQPAIVPEQAIPSDSTESGATANATTPEVVAEINITAPMNESRVELDNASPASSNERVVNPLSEPETVESEPATTTTLVDPNGWERIEPDTLSNKARSGEGAEPVRNILDTGVMHKVSRLSELPSAVRKDLPTVIFSGHLYSSNPASSIVFIDEGRPVMKGRQIMDELFLHEITPTGVIVEFRGYLIEVGVLQNWTLN